MSVKVKTEGPTAYVLIEDSSRYPPFKVENRSAGACLAYRQVGVSPKVWRYVPPMSWASLSLDDPKAPPLLRVAIRGSEDEAQSYDLRRIRALEPLTGAFEASEAPRPGRLAQGARGGRGRGRGRP